MNSSSWPKQQKGKSIWAQAIVLKQAAMSEPHTPRSKLVHFTREGTT